MTLNQLRTFLAVADTGSVRAAAQQLVVTQAAVSASLAALQRSLGVPLLQPDGRGLRLTRAGQAYAGYVRRILGLLDEAGLAATAAADPEHGELRIAAVTTAAEQIVPGLLGGFRSRHPRMGVRLEAGNRERVRALLDRHQVDLVLGGRPEPGWDVRVLAVRPHQLVVVASPALAASAAPGRGPAAVAGPAALAAPRARLGHPGRHRRAARRAGHHPADADGGLQRGHPRLGQRGPGRHPDIPGRGSRRAGRRPAAASSRCRAPRCTATGTWSPIRICLPPGRCCSSTCSATAASGRQLLILRFSVIAKLSIDRLAYWLAE